MNSLLAELLLLRRRTATWILLGFWTTIALLFSYVLPYYAYTANTNFHGRGIVLYVLLPQNLVSTITATFPFFGGTMILILGVLSMGSEYNWGTLTTVLVQRDSRLKFFLAKIAALAIAIVPFVLLVFLLGFLTSSIIALREDQAIILPSLWDLVRALSIGWFLLAVWASFGVLLAVLSKGTALAIGLGIIYGLVLEGIISSFGRQIDLLDQISKGLLRTNGYSLISTLGGSVTAEVGPGGFSGTTVSGTQASIVFGVYILLFVAISALVIRLRDVTGTS
ncbi:MAG: ABC transporter permease [Thermoleophilia bacterium]|jgi:ABC-type transport system involved in multi-copper enzyme maturation permease subunit